MIHASLQAADLTGPIHGLVTSYKRALRDHVHGLLNEDREDRGELADLILILLDGAVTEAYLKGVDHPAASAKRAVSTLLKLRSQPGSPQSPPPNPIQDHLTQGRQAMRSLLYMYDPLCGWCYAAEPGIARLQAAGVTVDLLPTGLFSEPGRTMTAEFADYAWKNDQRIATMTDQAFSEAYHRRVLQATGSAFDSTAATLALTAVALGEPAREADALRAVQEARYRLGHDITDPATLGEILSGAGFVAAAAALRAPSPALLSANAARVTQGAAMVREMGGRGVPTLVLVDGARRSLLDGGLLYGPAQALLAPFQIVVAA